MSIESFHISTTQRGRIFIIAKNCAVGRIRGYGQRLSPDIVRKEGYPKTLKRMHDNVRYDG